MVHKTYVPFFPLLEITHLFARYFVVMFQSVKRIHDFEYLRINDFHPVVGFHARKPDAVVKSDCPYSKSSLELFLHQDLQFHVSFHLLERDFFFKVIEFGEFEGYAQLQKF